MNKLSGVCLQPSTGYKRNNEWDVTLYKYINKKAEIK